MKFQFDTRRAGSAVNPMIYGHFIEHFHRQIYGGVYDPGNPLSDENGLRRDVIEAMRRIRVPILRWPGGCFVSSYHWKDGVGKHRPPMFDKAWRVEDPNDFGTDEYIALCRAVGCEPYICTNAGTGTPEEMSDWVEYCNLENEGRYARARIENGSSEPHGVKYWSIGNENYGSWEIGAKSAEEWGRLVLESAKMMKHVDPTIELSAAALTDVDWNVGLLKSCGERLDWISVHQYWDGIHQTNDFADYEASMAYTVKLSDSVDRVRGLLAAMGLDGQVKIAFDEWNLRGWYHPNVHTLRQGVTKEEYLYPRDRNDINSCYTMADAVFTACFLNMCVRNCDIVGMANFAPIVNTRGCIFTHRDGIVLRSTYHVFDLYANRLGGRLIDGWCGDPQKLEVRAKNGESVTVDALDVVATLRGDGTVAVAAVNKDPAASRTLEMSFTDSFAPARCRVSRVSGEGTESYNDVGVDGVRLEEGEWEPARAVFELPPHSIQVIELQ